MRNVAAATAAALACGLALLGAPQVAASAAPAAAAAATTLRIGSFNVQSVSLDKTSGNQRPWRERRAGAIADVLGEQLDVLGVQEANQSATFASRLVEGRNQYEDLRLGLNRAGGRYAIANSVPYNCVRADTSYRCDEKYRGASGGDRIFYNYDKLSVVTAGGTKFKVQESDTRYLAWAVLRVRATGKEILVANAHLATGESVRRAQWAQIISRVGQLRGSRPVVVLGDFNSHRGSTVARDMLPAMKSAGYGDVLNQEYNETPIAKPRARSSVNGWLNSWNRLDRNVRNWSYDENQTRQGWNIDYVFATNSMPVLQWEVVADFSRTTMQVSGTFPSDHNMVKATLSMS